MNDMIQRAAEVLYGAAPFEEQYHSRDANMSRQTLPWSVIPADDQAQWRTQAQALADAGLLPTKTEWGVLQPRRPRLHRGPWAKRTAEAWIQEGVDDGMRPGAFTLASRNVTPWKDADA